MRPPRSRRDSTDECARPESTSRSITACSTIIMVGSLSPFYSIGEYILRIRVTALRPPPGPADHVSNSKDSTAYKWPGLPRRQLSAVFPPPAPPPPHHFSRPA